MTPEACSTSSFSSVINVTFTCTTAGSTFATAASRAASTLLKFVPDSHAAKEPPAFLLNVQPAKRPTPKTEAITIVRARMAMLCEPRAGDLTDGATNNLPEVFHKGGLSCQAVCTGSSPSD